MPNSRVSGETTAVIQSALVLLLSMSRVVAVADQLGSKQPVVDQTNPAAGEKFDLSHWKLTLPIDASGSNQGKAVEVSSADLADGYTHADYFHTDANGSVVFWSPVTGATTENSDYPRSELREMLDPRDPGVNWTADGIHILDATCRVTEVPSSRKVIIGQIHSYSGKAKPLIKLQFYKGRIEALVKVSPNSGKDRKLTFPQVGLDNEIVYRIMLQDGVLTLNVNGTAQTENIFENDSDWAHQTFYFKAGAYTQDNKGPQTEGARVMFSRLSVAHDGD